MNIKVDDQGAEREPEPIAADVTGSMQRGLAYDPTDMLGERVSVEHVGLPSPDAHAVAAVDQSTWPAHLRDDAPYQRCDRCGRKTWAVEAFGTQCRIIQPDGLPCNGGFVGESHRRAPRVDRIAEPNPDPDGVEREPLDVQISRILRRRDVAAVRHETAVKLVLAAFADRLPRPAGALDAEAWAEHELDHDRQPTSARYVEYLLAPRPTAVTLDQRLALGAILVEHRNRADDTAGTIDAILTTLGLTVSDAEAGEQR